MQIKHITSYLESIAPIQLQESYDNSGLLVGDKNAECTGVLISLDCIEAVIDEAIEKDCNLIVAHHPIVFKGLKKLNGKNYVERTVIKAIKNNIAIYAIHTNLDNVANGVNSKIAEKLHLMNTRILSTKSSLLSKLVTYVPTAHFENVSQAIFEAGAGHIGNYSHCGFSSLGNGSFKPNKNTNPFVGEHGKIHLEEELRFETIVPNTLLVEVINALKEAHPYEEVAYDVFRLENTTEIGSGMIGELAEPMNSGQFIEHVKSAFGVSTFKGTTFLNRPIKKVAVCGGSGSFLLSAAKAQNADVFVTADFKYHEFFDAENDITIVDVGHYESERFTIDLLHDFLTENFPTFALLKSQVNTNPVNYY